MIRASRHWHSLASQAGTKGRVFRLASTPDIDIAVIIRVAMKRKTINLLDELRKAKRPVAHVCGPECFPCLVAAYARTVKRRTPVYAPKGRYRAGSQRGQTN